MKPSWFLLCHLFLFANHPWGAAFGHDGDGAGREGGRGRKRKAIPFPLVVGAIAGGGRQRSLSLHTVAPTPLRTADSTPTLIWAPTPTPRNPAAYPNPAPYPNLPLNPKHNADQYAFCVYCLEVEQRPILELTSVTPRGLGRMSGGLLFHWRSLCEPYICRWETLILD